MRILYVSPEVAPYAKTGGLADVAGALPQALRELGHEVWVIMPLYRHVLKQKELSASGLEEFTPPLQIRVRDPKGNGAPQEGVEEAQIFCRREEIGGGILFVRNDRYFDRENLYGTSQGDYPDNAERFLFFGRAVLELCRTGRFRPQVIHCNDWQTALIPIYLKTLYRDDPSLQDTASLFTIHNMGYQGIFPRETMELFGLGWELFTPSYLEYYNQVNLLKGGILFSDVVTTVSPRYSQEIQTPEYGHGLEGVLVSRQDRLFGVLNGVDYRVWNPATDLYLPAHYEVERLEGKRVCKAELQRRVGLPVREDVPLFGSISRLAAQKGFDLIAEVIDQLVSLDLQWVVLGKGDQQYEDLFREIAARFPHKVSVTLAFDESLAHQIEGGSDLFLMPSRYEPCGLNQIYSLKYGTVPLVRATGGLEDTVKDFDPSRASGTGFKFSDYSASVLFECAKRALTVYYNAPLWRELMRNGMEEDFSWHASARRYVELYETARSSRVEEETPVRANDPNFVIASATTQSHAAGH
ncbi:MAG: glycogen synthase GlgA [Candidatus Tectomicrobia bacterium]|uniref:Glycogen synthase n=1 Tax=Tectimicrobiota bacterium TaxID=2528274 RepID=A0A932CM75_UNCTE|nr:glycogen synthase GlgA [Candidatus Tectomicrobia bacterium]